MIGGERAELRRQSSAGKIGELVGMELDRQAAGARRREDPAGLLGREGDLLAEGIHRIGKPGDGGQHLLHHAVDIGPAAALELRRQGMGAEEAGPDRHALSGGGRREASWPRLRHRGRSPI